MNIGDLVIIFSRTPHGDNRMGLVIDVSKNKTIFTIQFTDGSVDTVGGLWLEKVNR
tara:strand:- start:44 stop:211 length:168 start_codon:yes stop_codon:yes gene_type:complete